MKKYRVKFYVVDYIEKELEVVADSKEVALEQAREMAEKKGEFNLVHWKTWKKPTVKRI